MRIYLAAAIAGAMLPQIAAAADRAAEGAAGISAESQFGLYCAGCHGDGGAGGGPFAASLEKPPADLTTLTRRNGGTFPRERVIMTIDGREAVKQHGSRDMPVWAEWFKIEAEEGLGGAAGDDAHVRQRIEAMVDYLETLQK